MTHTVVPHTRRFARKSYLTSTLHHTPCPPDGLELSQIVSLFGCFFSSLPADLSSACLCGLLPTFHAHASLPAALRFSQGEIVLRDGVYISDADVHLKMEGVYIRPFGHLRMVMGR